MEEPRITEKTSIEGIRKAVSQMQETYPNDALIIVPEGLWKDVKTEFLDKVLEKIRKRYEMNWFNDLSYGEVMGIIEEMKAEVNQ